MSTKSKETEAHDVQVNEIEALSAIFGVRPVLVPALLALFCCDI